MWVQLGNGTWSVQQPHGLTTLRVVVSTYNTVAHALDNSLPGFAAAQFLRAPDEVADYQ